ncbi:MAG: hypothetical protein CME66_08260, partial [Halobacteriovoraceae bacterium]|nr:hypothetical protein [Halobacteriovoraceae bacterium]
VDFSPDIQLNSIVGENKRFDINNVKKDDISLIQEIAYEQYIQQVPLEKRSTEVKDVYEKTIFWLSELKNQPNSLENRSSDPKEVLISAGYEVYDKRDNGGCLWVVYQEGIEAIIDNLKENGHNFVFTENGSRTTKKQPSYYMKS